MRSSVANGLYAVALGHVNVASGTAAVAIGDANTASGDYSVAMGRDCSASGDYSVAMGKDCSANAGASFAVVMGQQCTSTAMHAVALGDSCIAQDFAAVAMGTGCKAGGEGGVAMGKDCTTITGSGFAMGENCHSKTQQSVAMGQSCVADCSFSVALGYHANTNNSIGKNYQFVVGISNESFGGNTFFIDNSQNVAMCIGGDANFDISRCRPSQPNIPVVDISGDLRVRGYIDPLGLGLLNDTAAGAMATFSGMDNSANIQLLFAHTADNSLWHCFSYETAPGVYDVSAVHVGGGPASSGGDASLWNVNGTNFWGPSGNSLPPTNIGGTNTAGGVEALSNVAGSTTGNTAFGYQAGKDITGNNNVGIGNCALRCNVGATSTGNSNVAIGLQAMYGLTGNNNVGVGEGALASNHTGANNIGIGLSAGRSLVGDNNILMGQFAGDHFISGGSMGDSSYTIGLGAQAAGHLQGDHNIGLGRYAISDVSGNYNIAMGWKACQDLSGNHNIAIGYEAAHGAGPGSYNVAMGYNANKGMQGDNNVAIGKNANSNGNSFSHTIVINAEDPSLNPTDNSRCYIAPIRDALNTNALYYDTTTKEITYNPASSGGHNWQQVDHIPPQGKALTPNDASGIRLNQTLIYGTDVSGLMVGDRNTASGIWAVAIGDRDNTARWPRAAVAMGDDNTASGQVGGGDGWWQYG